MEMVSDHCELWNRNDKCFAEVASSVFGAVDPNESKENVAGELTIEHPPFCSLLNEAEANSGPVNAELDQSALSANAAA